ncbi:MAG: suppressor of fused domain protein [Planctomycetota bacterium]
MRQSNSNDPGIRRYDNQSPGEPQPVAGDDALISAVSSHIEKEVGPINTVFHSLISDKIHLDIHVATLRDEPQYTALITSGMSQRPMKAPPGAEDVDYAELAMLLPSDWPGLKAQKLPDDDTINGMAFLPPEMLEEASAKSPDVALANPSNYWPIQWLQTVAQFAHDYEALISVGDTIPNGDPPEPFAPNTQLCAWLVGPSMIGSGGFSELEHEGRIIHFYMLMPIHKAEMKLKMRKGVNALIQAFNEGQVDPVINPDRASCVKSKFLGLF